jgi:glycosyltransferase involved in cell wall biosynthesis
MTTTPFPSEKANIIQSIEVARALSAIGHDVDFYCPRLEHISNNHPNPMKEFESFNGTEIRFKPVYTHTMMPNKRFSAISTIPYMIKAINRSRQYDYFYVRNSYLLAILVLMGKKVIFEQHQWVSYRNVILSSIVRCITLLSGKNKNCKQFICISNELRKRWVNRGIPYRKTSVAHDAVDVNRFTPIFDKSEAKRRFGLQPDDLVIGYMGSLYTNRSIIDILDIASKLPGIKFRFAGGPEKEKQKLIQYSNHHKLENVDFIGRVKRTEVPEHLFASDILLFTMNENTLTYDICSPMKIFEYMAAARLIVAPNLPSLREVLKPDFSFLYTFPNKQSLENSIRSAIEAVKGNKSEEMGRKARRAVEKNYAWKFRMTKIFDELNNLR